MTPEQFAYWLQGYAELNEQPPTAEQWQSIREHLATVFHKVTPPAAIPRMPAAPVTWPATPLTGPLQPIRATCSSDGGTVLASGDGDTRMVC